MASKTTMGRRKSRAPLTRAKVLTAALRTVDKGGIESLSMRNIARVLKVEAMSLYNHVADKGDIVDGIIDLVFGEIDLPPSELDWKTAMRHRAISARQVLMRHRWAVGLMESRKHPGPANLRHHDAVLGSLRAAGFSIEVAAHAYSLLDSYTYGFVLQQLNLPFDSSKEVAEVAKTMVQPFPVNEYPNLAAMIQHALKPGYDFGNEFEFGLDLILDGIERMRHVTSRRSTSSLG
jgi:AcrR family transcriptional regulator